MDMKASLAVFALMLALSVHPNAARLTAQCSDFYGMTSRGGDFDNGTIFKTDGEGNNLEVLFSFPLTNEGKYPAGNLCVTPGGKYFGLTKGTYGGGAVIFEWDTSVNASVLKFKFINDPVGNIQSIGPLTLADNGKLYGMSQYRDSSEFDFLKDKRVIYEFDLSTNQYTERYNFIVDSSGLSPYGSMVKAGNGKLYGVTGMGGKNSSGVIFEWDPATGVYSKRFDFKGMETGYGPAGSPILGTNGNLYGLTLYGGANGGGVLFEWNPTTGQYCKRNDFSGDNQFGALLQSDDGNIYGTKGNTFFVWDPVAKSFSPIYTLTDQMEGDSPAGALVQAANGKFYGTTARGGTENLGVLFEWDPSTGIYTKKLDFIGNENGGNPSGALILLGEHTLAGLTENGGTYESGVLFEWDIEQDTYTKKLDFNEGENGSVPQGSLVSLNKEKLLGTAITGGKYNDGVLFEWDILNRTFEKKADFKGNENGKAPVGTMIMTDDGKFLGVTKNGGENDKGVIFGWDPETGELSDKFDFMDENYVNPVGTLLKANDGNIYGLTSMGGGSYDGVLFELGPSGEDYTVKYLFDRWTPDQSAPLIQGDDGKIYGIGSGVTVETDGGVIFEWDQVADTALVRKLFLPGLIYPYPSGSLIQADNGNFYAKLEGPQCGLECMFMQMMEWDPVLDTILYGEEIILPDNGAGHSYGSLIQAQNGKIYGTAPEGGENGLGIIFECDPLTLVTVTKHSFSKPGGSSPCSTLLELEHKSFSSKNIEACGMYTSPGGKIWSESGEYTDTILTSSGCDSIITVNLTVHHPDKSVTQEEGVLTSMASDATWQWIDCDNGNSPIEGETGQTFTAGQDGHYAVIVTQDECSDTSACFDVTSSGRAGYLSGQDISVFPNPSDGTFSVDLGRIWPEVTVTVMRPDGRILQKESHYNTRNMDLNIHTSAGIYFLVISSENERSVVKVVRR